MNPAAENARFPSATSDVPKAFAAIPLEIKTAWDLKLDDCNPNFEVCVDLTTNLGKRRINIITPLVSVVGDIKGKGDVGFGDYKIVFVSQPDSKVSRKTIGANNDTYDAEDERPPSLRKLKIQTVIWSSVEVPGQVTGTLTVGDYAASPSPSGAQSASILNFSNEPEKTAPGLGITHRIHHLIGDEGRRTVEDSSSIILSECIVGLGEKVAVGGPRCGLEGEEKRSPSFGAEPVTPSQRERFGSSHFEPGIAELETKYQRTRIFKPLLDTEIEEPLSLHSSMMGTANRISMLNGNDSLYHNDVLYTRNLYRLGQNPLLLQSSQTSDASLVSGVSILYYFLVAFVCLWVGIGIGFCCGKERYDRPDDPDWEASLRSGTDSGSSLSAATSPVGQGVRRGYSQHTRHGN